MIHSILLLPACIFSVMIGAFVSHLITTSIWEKDAIAHGKGGFIKTYNGYIFRWK